jgi:hypothetical protein
VVTAPLLDPAAVETCLDRLALSCDDPPTYVAVIPPFSLPWIARAEGWGAVSAGSGLLGTVERIAPERRRKWAWERVEEIRTRALAGGAAGVIVMGLKYDTVVEEAAVELTPQHRYGHGSSSPSR